MEWVLAEAETGKTGKQDVYTYLAKTWLPLVSRGNYFVYIPEVDNRSDLQTKVGSFIHSGSDKRYPTMSNRRDINKFNYRNRGTTGIGLKQFLDDGLSWVEHHHDNRHTIQLLTPNQNAKIQCLDAKSDQSSPFNWINERMSDYKYYAKSLKLSPESRTKLDQNFKHVEEEIMSWYKTGQKSGSNPNHIQPDGGYSTPEIETENEQRRLKRILWLINIELPKVIGTYADNAHPEGAPSYNTNLSKMAGNFRMHHNLNATPDTDRMKGIRDVGLDIISHSCPISISNWILIFNPQSIRIVDSVSVNQEFMGLQKTKDKKSIFIPSAQGRQENAMMDKLKHTLRIAARPLATIIGAETYLSEQEKYKKIILDSLKYAGILAKTLATSQPNLADQLVDEFKHVQDQIQPTIEQLRIDWEQYQEFPDEAPSHHKWLKPEIEAWEEVEKAFAEAIKGIRNT